MEGNECWYRTTSDAVYEKAVWSNVTLREDSCDYLHFRTPSLVDADRIIQQENTGQMNRFSCLLSVLSQCWHGKSVTTKT